MKMTGFFGAIAKSELPLNTTPVGVPVVPAAAFLVVGMVTTTGLCLATAQVLELFGQEQKMA